MQNHQHTTTQNTLYSSHCEGATPRY